MEDLTRAALVLRVRTRVRLSRREFARRLNVTENTIYRWEAGKRTVLPRHIQRIEEVYGIVEARCPPSDGSG